MQENSLTAQFGFLDLTEPIEVDSVSSGGKNFVFVMSKVSRGGVFFLKLTTKKKTFFSLEENVMYVPYSTATENDYAALSAELNRIYDESELLLNKEVYLPMSEKTTLTMSGYKILRKIADFCPGYLKYAVTEVYILKNGNDVFIMFRQKWKDKAKNMIIGKGSFEKLANIFINN